MIPTFCLLYPYPIHFILSPQSKFSLKIFDASALFKILSSFPLSLEKCSKFLVLSLPSYTSIQRWCFRPSALWKGTLNACLHAIKSYSPLNVQSPILINPLLILIPKFSQTSLIFSKIFWECQQVSMGNYFEYNTVKQNTYLPNHFLYCFLSKTVGPKSLTV